MLAISLVTLLLLGAPPQEMVEEGRLMAFMKEMPVKRAPLGSDAHREGLQRTQDLLVERLGALGLEPALHEFRWSLPTSRPAEGEGAEPKTTWHNIIVDLPGTDLSGEVLVVGAHFDAVPRSPGADDNATGTSALLELARVLKDQPRRRTVRLAFFNLEEVGLIGSTRYVRSLSTEERGRIVGMMSLEMLGYFSDEPDSQKSPLERIEGVFEPPTVGDSIAVVGIAQHRAFSGRLIEEMGKAEPKLKITPADFLPVAIPDMMRSDHRPFVTAGLPGVMITDTANFRNPHYHQETDTAETLDKARYTLVVRAVAGAIDALANAEGWKVAPNPEAPAVEKPAVPPTAGS